MIEFFDFSLAKTESFDLVYFLLLSHSGFPTILLVMSCPMQNKIF